MKKTMRSLLCLVLVLLLAVGCLTACGDKPADTSEPTSGDESSAPENPGESSETGDESGDPTDPENPDATTGTGESGTTASAWINIPTSGKNAGKTTAKTTTKKQQLTTKPSTAVGNDFWSSIPKELSGKTVKYLTWWEIGDGEKAMAENFKKKTGMTVKPEVIALDKYEEKLAAKAVSGGADCAALRAEYYPQQITKRLFTPISKGAFDLTDPIYDLSSMEYFKWKGDYYGVEFQCGTSMHYLLCLWYKDIFKSKKLTTTPQTLWKSNNWNWDTMLDLAKKTTDTNIFGLGFIWNWFWVASRNSDLILKTDDAFVSNFDDPNIYEGFKYAYDLRYTYKVSPPGYGTLDEFISGKFAMFIIEDYGAQDRNIGEMKDEWGCVPMPAPKGQSYVTPCTGHLWGLINKAKNPKGASYWLRYVQDDDNQLVPDYTNKEVYDVEAWQAAQPKRIWLSNGVINYGGEHEYQEFQNDIDKALPGELQSKLNKWRSVYEANLAKIMKEYNS